MYDKIHYNKKIIIKKKSQFRDFPGVPVGESPLSNAENVSSIPGQGTKIPNVTGQLSLKARTGWKPVLALQ